MGKVYKIRKCEMTVGTDIPWPSYYPCGKPAKFRSPKDNLPGKRMFICGTHRRSIDAMYKRLNMVERCKALIGV